MDKDSAGAGDTTLLLVDDSRVARMMIRGHVQQAYWTNWWARTKP